MATPSDEPAYQGGPHLNELEEAIKNVSVADIRTVTYRGHNFLKLTAANGLKGYAFELGKGLYRTLTEALAAYEQALTTPKSVLESGHNGDDNA